MFSRDEVFALLQHSELSQKQEKYIHQHALRFSVTTELVEKYLAPILEENRTPRVLDIAPHYTTVILNAYFKDRITLNTLGWLDESLISRSDINEHFDFNLNKAQFLEDWIDFQPHDLLLMGEIIEHLYTAPEFVLGFVSKFLAKDGLLVIQTPNAVSARKRIRMMMGIHPFDLLNKNRHGHFREYTAGELERLCNHVGLEVVQSMYCDYWPERSKLLRVTEKLIPSLRKGLLVVAKKVSDTHSELEFVDKKIVG